jgi:ubiquinone/menaquinone biosynthesis C-methylase UbiE
MPRHSRHEHGHHHPHEHQHRHEHDEHGNPHDLARYLEKLTSDERGEWQQPDRVVKALALKKGATAADVGVGPGYFALRMAKAVGRAGRVFGVDVEPRLLAELVKRVAAARVKNVTPVLGLPGDPLLPPRSCDLILIVNMFHHVPDPVAFLRTLARALRPRGRIVNIDFQKGDFPLGPPIEHKIAREEFLRLAARAGLRLAREHTFLAYQYFLELRAPS